MSLCTKDVCLGCKSDDLHPVAAGFLALAYWCLLFFLKNNVTSTYVDFTFGVFLSFTAVVPAPRALECRETAIVWVNVGSSPQGQVAQGPRSGLEAIALPAFFTWTHCQTVAMVPQGLTWAALGRGPTEPCDKWLPWQSSCEENIIFRVWREVGKTWHFAVFVLYQMLIWAKMQTLGWRAWEMDE